MTTVQPDNRALDSLLDRTFGKPAQPVELPPPDPIVLDAAQKLIITLQCLNATSDAEKVAQAIEVVAKLRKVPVEALERQVKGLLGDGATEL